MKKILAFLFFGVLFFPQIGLSADVVTIDQRCWTKPDCETFRKDFATNETEGGFFSGKDNELIKKACHVNGDGIDINGRELGFCLPAGISKTAVSFGDRTKFENLGDFIQFLYKYGFQVGSVLAVIVIIVAGIMYIFSGGNTDTVGSAKKKIAGAVIGLVLMALSYTILNVINPYLVNLKMPEVWAINRIGITPALCTQVKGATESASSTPRFATSTAAGDPSAVKMVDKKDMTFICGEKYFVEGNGTQTCGGNECPESGQTCYQQLFDKDKACHTANIAGIVYASSLADKFIQSNTLTSLASTFVGDGYEFPWVTDNGKNDIDIHAICGNGSDNNIGVSTEDPTDAQYKNDKTLRQEYFITLTSSEQDSLNSLCPESVGGLKGFAVYISLNEEGDADNEEHFFGINRATGEAIDVGRHGDDETKTEIFAKDCVNKYLITKDELTKGLYLPIDVSGVCDVESGDEGGIIRKRCYSFVGYTSTKDECASQAQNQ